MNAIELTEAQREALKEKLAALDRVDEEIDAAMTPFRRVQMAVEGIREALIEEANAQGGLAGTCDTCGKILFEGERGHSDTEAGIYWCEEHAPTYGDALENWRALDDDFEDEWGTTRAEAIARIEKYVTDGGSLADKIIHEI